MRRELKLQLWTAALAVGCAIGTVIYAQGFNARTGTWEFTMVMKGAMPVEGVPPEVAAQIQAELSKPQRTTSCITAADLKNFRLGRFDEDGEETCKVLSTHVTATTLDVVRQCTNPAFTETAHFEAPTPQAITGNMSREMADGTMTITMNGKWVAAACME